MKTTELTIQQIERAIRKIADKFPPSEEANVMSDIHFRGFLPADSFCFPQVPRQDERHGRKHVDTQTILVCSGE